LDEGGGEGGGKRYAGYENNELTWRRGSVIEAY